MTIHYIHHWHKDLKLLVGTFLVVLSIGFFTGLNFVENTSKLNSKGIQENYLGNEADTTADTMKFKKTERHIISVIHSHILSMSVFFFLVALLVYHVDCNTFFKRFLLVEPLLSVLTTFGGIYFLWTGILWMKYIVMLSGVLMTLSYTVSVGLIFWNLFRKK